jgi:hypothetical protein
MAYFPAVARMSEENRKKSEFGRNSSITRIEMECHVANVNIYGYIISFVSYSRIVSKLKHT